jgi:uncharacterized membrane protein YcaP (DUF421 family)
MVQVVSHGQNLSDDPSGLLVRQAAFMSHLLLASIPDDLFTVGVPLAEKILRTIAVYLGILVLLRLGGKRDLAQLNTFDLVVLLLLSNVVQNAVIGPDNSLLGGLLGAATLLAVNSVLARVARSSDVLDRLFEGTATTLVEDGQIDHEALARLGLREADVELALRQQGAMAIDDVERASLEPGGTILLTLHDLANPATRADVQRLEAKLDRLLAG